MSIELHQTARPVGVVSLLLVSDVAWAAAARRAAAVDARVT